MPELLNNKENARAHLQILSSKLTLLTVRYNEMENNGDIEEIPKAEEEVFHPVFYLPHRLVVKEGSTSTKVRPVFDDSAKGPNGISLGDCLEAGPSLIPKLADVLILSAIGQ